MSSYYGIINIGYVKKMEGVKKEYQKIFYILMFLALVISMIALVFLPDLIPVHYNIKNEIDRWWSKYEILIIPIITILLGEFLLFMRK